MNSVTFVIGQLVLGGAEKQLYLLVKGLLARGWKVSVITLHGGHGDYWEKPIRDLGVPLCEISTNFRLGALIKMLAFIKKHPTKILHSWSTFTGIYALILSLLTDTKICIGSQRTIEKNSLREYGNFLYWLSYVGFKGITVNSRFGFHELKKRWPKKGICFIPNGLNIQGPSNEPEKVDKNSLREQFNIPTDLILVGAVGMMIPIKRFDLLIDSMKIIQQKGFNCGVVIIGDGPLKSNLSDRAADALIKGTYFFPGFINEAEKYMAMFDIYCLTSDYEGTPNVILEALASGVPVISTNIGDVGEIIEPGVSGLILSTNEPEALSQFIIDLIVNPDLSLKFSKNGKEKIIKSYDTDIMVERMVDFYQKMSNGSEMKRKS
jgi:glycosyltransferase involved in cell wall biosynthesis